MMYWCRLMTRRLVL